MVTRKTLTRNQNSDAKIKSLHKQWKVTFQALHTVTQERQEIEKEITDLKRKLEAAKKKEAAALRKWKTVAAVFHKARNSRNHRKLYYTYRDTSNFRK